MPPLEWLTPERAMRWLDSFGVVLYVVLGLLSLALGLTSDVGPTLFGVDAYLWLGVGFLLFAGYWKASQSRRLPSERK